MTVKKFYPTPEGILDDNRYQEKRRGDPEQREKCPEAYLLTVKEAKTLYTIRDIILDVTVKYSGMIAGADPEKEQERIKRNLNPEQIEGIKQDEIIAEIERRKISVKLLRNITEKAKAAATWTAVSQFKIGQKGSPLIQEYFLIQTTTPEQIPDRAITPENCPEFYSAENQAEKARALNIPELYLYVSPVELNILHDLNILIERIDIVKQAQINEPRTGVKNPETEKFYSVINSNVMNALYSMGANVKKPTVKKARDEKGRQMELTEFINNLGDTVSLKDFNPFNNGESIISVGDPNADKLLLQIEILTMQTRRQEFDIPISDFIRFRGLSEKKSDKATDKARKACTTLANAQLTIDHSNETASLFGIINYMQECYVLSKKGRGGNLIHVKLSDKLYEHIISMSDSGQFIEQLDKSGMQIPDNYGTAYNIWRKFSSNNRIKAGERASHRLSVKTLLSFTLLPLYPVNDADIGKPYYLRYRSEAKERIIKPFIEALEYLVDNKIFKEYTFTKANGKKLNDAELEQLNDNFALFSSLNIDVVFTNEPDYTHLIENKAKQKTKAEKKGKA